MRNGYLITGFKLSVSKLRMMAILLPLIYLMVSCNQDKLCSQSIESALNAGIYALENGEQIDSLIFHFSTKGLNRPDTFPDSSLYKDVKNIKKFRLPFAPDTAQCSFVLVFDSIPERVIQAADTFVVFHSFKDTIHFTYTRQLKLLSPECGFIMEYTLKAPTYTHNAIDSISIIQPDINTRNEENIRIFL